MYQKRSMEVEFDPNFGKVVPLEIFTRVKIQSVIIPPLILASDQGKI